MVSFGMELKVSAKVTPSERMTLVLLFRVIAR